MLDNYRGPRRLVAALSQASFSHRLASLVASDQAIPDLRRYFGTGLPCVTAPFTGSRFEHLAGGGDRPAVANPVTAEDLIAVQTLSVRIPAQVALPRDRQRVAGLRCGALDASPYGSPPERLHRDLTFGGPSPDGLVRSRP
ncbi:DUF6308 family protein [Streptomyces yangpuensis]|uniref:DUF6308 family protein n=1 Tax=Streptomyces yangpuensis TaxID=1648182 RepID=UPI00365626DC